MGKMKSNDVYLDSDGTLGISADVDISKVKRILLTQEGTHYGSMYYQDLPDTNVGNMNDSEITNSCDFKPGDKFILEIGKRKLDAFEIAGTDYHIEIDLLKMIAPYNPEQNTETRTVVVVGDLVYRQQAIDAVTSICDSCDSIYCGDCRVNYPGEKDARKVLEDLPPAQKNGYTKADYIMALHKEYGCSISRAEEAHQKALEYLRNTSIIKG